MCGQLQLQAKSVAASSPVIQHWHPHQSHAQHKRVKRLNKSDKHMSIKSYKGKCKKFISQPSAKKFSEILSIKK